MKITGKQSLSTILKLTLLLLFIFFVAHLFYFLVGYGIAQYKYHTGSKIFNETVILGVNAAGYDSVKSFQLVYPFSKQNFIFGELNLQTLLIQGFGFAVFSFYLFCLYKIFNLLSKKVLFNKAILKWFSIFIYLNLFSAVFYILIWGVLYQWAKPGNLILNTFPLIIIFIFTIFLRSFFKKGYELQSENDLTI